MLKRTESKFIWPFDLPRIETGLRALALALLVGFGCGEVTPQQLVLDPPHQALSEGRWRDALALCKGGDQDSASCDARWCVLLARTMLWVDDVNDFLLPAFRSAGSLSLGMNEGDLIRLLQISTEMATLSSLVQPIVDARCEYDIPRLPFRFGDADDPIVLAEARGRFTPGNALFIGATIDSIRYIFAATEKLASVPPPPLGSIVPALPNLLEDMRVQLAAHGEWIRSHPVTADDHTGGWLDSDGNGVMSAADGLLVDLFEPGTDRRVFDFEKTSPIEHEILKKDVFTKTAELPLARCGYKIWHIDTLFSEDVGTTDGLSFSPDGTRIAFPKKVDGLYQVHVANADGSGPVCITCDHPRSGNDGVRWRPGDPQTMIFLSTRDHPHAVGGAGGGFGQELYAMHADGSGATRLTTSGAWATNYHANFSHDGMHLVWGSTQNRSWDVMVADFVNDQRGMRLENVRRLTHDTTWWETHDFSLDGTKVLTTNTRAGWQAADLYAIDVQSGALTRVTDDPAWDEHAHLSPDGRKISWISGRWRPASVSRLTDNSLSAAYDFFWIGPSIFANFINPPAGFSAELTMMDADGSRVQRLTFDNQVCADNAWSPDAKRILFRQTPTATDAPARIRLLTFDDCQ